MVWTSRTPARVGLRMDFLRAEARIVGTPWQERAARNVPGCAAPRPDRPRTSRLSSATTGPAPTAPPTSSSTMRAAAEDIAQEAFLSAVRALDSFDRRRPFRPLASSHRREPGNRLDSSKGSAARGRRRAARRHTFAAGDTARRSQQRDHGRAGLASRPTTAQSSSCATSSTTRPARSPSCSSCRAAPSTRASGAAWTPCRSAS